MGVELEAGAALEAEAGAGLEAGAGPSEEAAPPAATCPADEDAPCATRRFFFFGAERGVDGNGMSATGVALIMA